MAAHLKATDDQIRDAYAATGSVWLGAEMLGMGGQAFHERTVKLGINKPINVFTDAEVEFLRGHYTAYADTGKLSALAEKMGRTKQFLCRQAKALGITDPSRPRPYIATWKYMTEEAASLIWEDFKASKYGLKAYCDKRGYDDLGFSKRMKELFSDEYEHVIELKAPKGTPYKLGRAVEYRVRDLLKVAGYFVMRSPQSKSPVDLLAVASGVTLMVQCKRSGSIGVAEWNTLFELATSTGAKPILAMTDAKRGRGLLLFEMTAPKDGSRRAQPMVPFTP
jgi:Holliday junction resolvase